MAVRDIGCCGAYCRTCRVRSEGQCLGCKLGYESGKRDIKKAKCKIKICCFKERNYETCADCSCYPCDIFKEKGWIYKKYGKKIEFIKKEGYKVFLRKANKWKNSYGKL